MVLGSHLDVAALVELEVAVIAALKRACSRVVHIEHGEAVIHLDGCAAVTGLDADDCGLVDIVALEAGCGADASGIGIEYRQDEVAVTQATPAPVDVEVVAIGIAVAHKRVATTSTGTAVVDHGTTLDQFIINHVFPVGLVIVAAVDELGVVVEVFVESGGDIGVAGARRVQAILHLGSTAGIEHEPSDGIFLGLGLGTRVVVAHVVPVKEDGIQRIGLKCTVFLMPVKSDDVGRNELGATHGVLVVVHDLSHRGGHTSRVGQLAHGIALLGDIHELGAVVPVGSCLVPVAGDHRGNTVAGGAGRCELIALDTQLVEVADLLGIAVKPSLHVAGHIIGVIAATVGVTQDGDGAVVAAHNDITLLADSVKNIIVRKCGRLLAIGHQSW